MSAEGAGVTWYELDSGTVAAIVPGGIFLLRQGGWSWHPHQSDVWDAIHQGIHRQGHATRLEAAPPGAPPLPDPGPPHVEPDRDDPGEMRRDPKLVAWLSAAPGARRSAYLVLEEDPYESLLGDGLFRYTRGCFPTRENAQAFIDAQPKRMTFHIREIALRLENGEVRATGERRDFADRYQVEGILSGLLHNLT